MGDVIEPRREFIQKNALIVANPDVWRPFRHAIGAAFLFAAAMRRSAFVGGKREFAPPTWLRLDRIGDGLWKEGPMLRFILALLILSVSLAPSAAFAQANETKANESTPLETNTTTKAVETANRSVATDTSRPDAQRSEATDPEEPLEASGTALLKLFVLAVILESALALLFNWRPFVARYDGRGVKAPISLAAALALVFAFKPDAIADLMEGYDANVGDAGRFFARVIEAMVIAGGSAGVNRLMVTLGFRSQIRAQDVIARPKPTEAWISVGLVRENAQGPVNVMVKEGKGQEEIAGTISGTRAATRSYFRRDFGRLPPAGGRPVTPGEEVSVTLVDKDGKRSATWGPYRLATGAIVDIDLVL